MAKKTTKRNTRKNTRVFYTLAKKDHELYWSGSAWELSNVYKTQHGDYDWSTVHDCVGGDMLIVRCTPKEYDDLRKAMEYMKPGLYEWDVDVNKSTECMEE